ncbi:hypothetical protein [Aquisphaera insulae]|uniref:hypothetical protein n=1 Tax=Aquisphaera insulae TaxID=2712864 RepID=UPI0013EAA7CF|nr:hypothetical protein [Aquisphaera insulae]
MLVESILFPVAALATAGIWHAASALPPATANIVRVTTALAWAGYFALRIVRALAGRPRRINP